MCVWIISFCHLSIHHHHYVQYFHSSSYVGQRIATDSRSLIHIHLHFYCSWSTSYLDSGFIININAYCLLSSVEINKSHWLLLCQIVSVWLLWTQNIHKHTYTWILYCKTIIRFCNNNNKNKNHHLILSFKLVHLINRMRLRRLTYRPIIHPQYLHI